VAFVREAYRVLRSGGLLIMETPNPENIRVATETFYLDPTHRRPIPSSLLAFLPEEAGFAYVEVLLLQESRELEEREISLYDVLYGVSPDYAVVAFKGGETDTEAYRKLLELRGGVTLPRMTERFEERLKKLEGRIEGAEEKIERAEEKAEGGWRLYRGLVESPPWKFWKGIRRWKRTWARRVGKERRDAWVREKRRALLRIAAGMLNASKDFALRHPAVERGLKRILGRFPGLKYRLKELMHRSELPERDSRN
jgi:O-antigen chain-terminating methyltransferase